MLVLAQNNCNGGEYIIAVYFIYVCMDYWPVLLGLCRVPESQQRIGSFYLSLVPQLRNLYVSYCSNHPSAVNVLTQHGCVTSRFTTQSCFWCTNSTIPDEHRCMCVFVCSEELGEFMESKGASSPGILTLTTGLSKPFLRLEKYPTLLKEMERHMEVTLYGALKAWKIVRLWYVDLWHSSFALHRNSTQIIQTFRRAWQYLKTSRWVFIMCLFRWCELTMSRLLSWLQSQCQEVRKRKELELQILTENIRGWEGENIKTLGSVLYMSQVFIQNHGAEVSDLLRSDVVLINFLAHEICFFLFRRRMSDTSYFSLMFSSCCLPALEWAVLFTRYVTLLYQVRFTLL